MRLQTTQNIGNILGNLKKDVYEAYRENLPKRKMTRAEQTQNETVVRCVRPQLNSEAMAITMDNYRAFVAEYNEKIRKTNAVIAKHNAELVPESEYTQVQQVLKNVFLGKYGTFETRFCPKTGKEIKQFKRKSDINAKKYNELVTDFCSHYGNILEMEKYQTIKANSEQVFQQMLYAYSLQLEQKDRILNLINVEEYTPIAMVNVCSTRINYMKRNGNRALAVCSKTIINHRHRFEEAGILIDYQNLGSGKFGGVLYHINPAILVIFEAKTGRFAVAENQSFIYGLEKKVTDITMNNIQEQKNKSEIKANVDNNSPKRSSLSLTKFRIQEPSLQEHQLQSEDLNQGGGGENVKKTSENVKNDAENEKSTDKKAQLAQMLLKTTLHPTDLCEQLAKGAFNSHKVIDIRLLQLEADTGILTSEEFFEVVIQDILKQSAKLYIGKNVYAGTWQNAYNQLKENYFRTFTGGVMPKYIVVEMMQEYRWRLGYAHRYCLSHPEFNLLFPSDYFDRTRKTRHEGGFEYTKKAWNKHLKDTEKTKNRKLATKRKAKLREGKIFSAKEVTDKIKQFLKARITIETLYNFVEKNHPSFLPHLSDMTHKIQAQLQKSK